jgi:hypothetical protein
MPTRKKTAPKKTTARKEPKASPKARKPSQLDRIERILKDHGSKINELLDRTEDRITGSPAPINIHITEQPEGLQPGDYTDASKETADALTAMGFKWHDLDRTKCKLIEWRMDAVIVNWDFRGRAYLDPATFLSRAAVTAKALGLVPVEPWAPVVGQWVKFRDGSWQQKKYGGIAKVKRGLTEEGHYLTECVSAEPSGYYFEVSEARPATEDEIAAHLAEQDAMKPVVFGTRVNHTTLGQGIWMGMDGILHELAFLKHGKDHQHQWSTILCPRAMFTVID